MHVALLIQNADRRAGGAEGYTLDLARMLAERGHRVAVVAEGGPPSTMTTAQAEGFECRFLGAHGGHRWARLKNFLARLQDVYDERTYDVVHAMLPVPRCDVYQPHSGLALDMWQTGHTKYAPGLVQRWARRFNHWNFKRRGLARVEAAMMQHKPWLLCLSNAMRQFASEHYALPDDRLVLLINGINLARFDPTVGLRRRQGVRAEWQIADHQRLALLVGNNWKLKGVREAIQALARQPDRRTVLMMVGRGNPDAFRAPAEKLGVSAQVHFVGSVIDTRPYYGAADYLLLPTRRDTCSLVVLEALAMGRPVVTTHQNGASDVLTDGREGVILEQGDVEGLAAAMGGMLDDRRLASMSRAALALREELSFDRHVQRIEEVYARVLADRQAGVPQVTGRT